MRFAVIALIAIALAITLGSWLGGSSRDAVTGQTLRYETSEYGQAPSSSAGQGLAYY